jgi:hypothetical protein
VPAAVEGGGCVIATVRLLGGYRVVWLTNGGFKNIAT